MADRTAAGGWQRSVVRVVLSYAFFAALWILVSDRVAGWLFRDPELLVRAGTVKGWVFVGVTSLLLYGMLQRSWRKSVADLAERARALKLVASIAESSEDAIYAKDAEGRFLLFNRAAGRFVGRAPAEVLGQDSRALFPPAQAEALMALDRRVMAEDRSLSEEEVLDTRIGQRVFLATKGPLHDAEGNVVGVFGVSRDITERKRAEEALQQLSDDLAATLRAIPDLLFEMDDEGRYLKVEATAHNLLAAPPEELLGRTVGEMLPPDAARTCLQALVAAGRAGADYGRTITLPLDGGSHHFELSVARKMTPPGAPQRFIMLSRDITARKAAEEELKERNAELERFNRATVGRELDMVELKKRVNALSRELGREPPYPLAFLGDGQGDRP
ncbi:MAG: PAS domain-containing protein [Deltaproteobacteria bacterium]|nr:PAS domain-containing protein [Deltaproteobacteria bacterium]